MLDKKPFFSRTAEFLILTRQTEESRRLKC
jgi:hypothetical protein